MSAPDVSAGRGRGKVTSAVPELHQCAQGYASMSSPTTGSVVLTVCGPSYVSV